MAEKILFLTGKLAQPSVERVLTEMAPLPFEYRVHQLGVSVAALMTDKMIARRLKPEDYDGFKQIIVPGRCRGDLTELSKTLGIDVVRGPEEIKDLPLFFGKAGKFQISADTMSLFLLRLSMHPSVISQEYWNVPAITVKQAQM